ncbi:MAG: hypothetical protein ACPW60_14180 [Methylohalobius sp. ZOD2]
MKRIGIALLSFFLSMTIVLPAVADRDYARYRGYRERPYDKSRHYDYYSRRGNRYIYRGHWRSWNDWNDYARRYPRIYKRGRYYREHGHLMFRFCDPGTGNCFFFSIGR